MDTRLSVRNRQVQPKNHERIDEMTRYTDTFEPQGFYSHLSKEERAIQAGMDALYVKQQKHHTPKMAKVLSGLGIGYTGSLCGQPGRGMG